MRNATRTPKVRQARLTAIGAAIIVVFLALLACGSQSAPAPQPEIDDVVAFTPLSPAEQVMVGNYAKQNNGYMQTKPLVAVVAADNQLDGYRLQYFTYDDHMRSAPADQSLYPTYATLVDALRSMERNDSVPESRIDDIRRIALRHAVLVDDDGGVLEQPFGLNNGTWYRVDRDYKGNQWDESLRSQPLGNDFEFRVAGMQYGSGPFIGFSDQAFANPPAGYFPVILFATEGAKKIKANKPKRTVKATTRPTTVPTTTRASQPSPTPTTTTRTTTTKPKTTPTR